MFMDYFTKWLEVFATADVKVYQYELIKQHKLTACCEFNLQMANNITKLAVEKWNQLVDDNHQLEGEYLKTQI